MKSIALAIAFAALVPSKTAGDEILSGFVLMGLTLCILLEKPININIHLGGAPAPDGAERGAKGETTK